MRFANLLLCLVAVSAVKLHPVQRQDTGSEAQRTLRDVAQSWAEDQERPKLAQAGKLLSSLLHQDTWEGVKMALKENDGPLVDGIESDTSSDDAKMPKVHLDRVPKKVGRSEDALEEKAVQDVEEEERFSVSFMKSLMNNLLAGIKIDLTNRWEKHPEERARLENKVKDMPAIDCDKEKEAVSEVVTCGARWFLDGNMERKAKEAPQREARSKWSEEVKPVEEEESWFSWLR